MSLIDALPEVPEALRPISDTELQITPEEAKARPDMVPGAFRTRVAHYHGWGAADFPIVTVPDHFTRARPELKNLVYARTGTAGVNVLLPPGPETAAIDGRKFDPHAPDNPVMLVNTAEEWVVYNDSIPLWGDTHPAHQPSYQYKSHYVGLPMTARQALEHSRHPHFRIVTAGMDHPFHMHVNPLWVTRIEVPDETGELHNILSAPQWMDTVAVPRGGRVVFRSRFLDYVGSFVHHCHVLVHEDYGMMRLARTTASAGETNYVARPRVSSRGMSSLELTTLYGRPSLADCYRRSAGFIDGASEWSYPGFTVTAPSWRTS
jgi:hypothetical protein